MIPQPLAVRRSAGRPDARRGGFTLIEMVLATSLGGMVVLACLGVLGMIQRGDTTLARRSTQTTELSTLHGLVQAALGSLMMSNDQRPAEDEADADPTSEAQPEIRPRMILAEDPAVAPLARRAAYAAGGSGRQVTRPQVFELVLSSPVAGYDRPADLSDDASAQLDETRLAVRGVFELRPDRDDTWALWWRPVLEDGSPITTDLAYEQSAVRLAGGLTQLRWQVFHDSQRKTAFEATWSDDLPAYIELELTTSSGLYANWMFEVGWSSGPEIVTPETEVPAETDDTPAGTPGGPQTDGLAGGRPGAPGGGNRLGPGGRPTDGRRPNRPNAPREMPPGAGGRP